MKQFVYILILQLFVFEIIGQDVEFTADAPGVVEVGETFNLTYSINVKPENIELPDINDFTIIGGPSQGHSSSVQIINGKVQQSSTHTYSYYLRAANPGKFSLSAAKAVYKNNEYSSNELTIEVVGGGQTQGTASAPQQNNQIPSTSEDIPSDEELFVRLHVDRSNVYLNEPVTAYIKLYTKVSIVDIDRGYKGPDYSGFFRQDVEIPPLRSLKRENVNGVLYNTGVIQKVILYPQKTGEIMIKPFEMEVVTQKQIKRRSRSIFDDFFGTSVQNIPVNLKSNAVKIKVKSLPAGKPVDFYGGVGSFKINSEINSTTIKANDALTYKIKVSGKGNVRLIKDIKPDFPPGIEVYGPETDLNINNYSGSKVYEYTLIPRHAGEFKIPGVKFSYFDLKSKSFKTINTEEYTLTVEKSESDSTSIVVSNLSKEEVKLLGSDIKFIEQDIVLSKNQDILYGTRKFYLMYIISFVFFITIVILRRGQIKRNADIVRVRNKKANKLARKNLRIAKQLLNQKEPEKYYEEVLKGMWRYLSYKLNIPLADLSKSRANDELNKYKVDKELIGKFFEIIDNCELARYAPAGSEVEKETLYKNAYKIISKLEQKIK